MKNVASILYSVLYYIAVAGHFLGNNSILDFVQAGGFDVMRMEDVNVKVKGKKRRKAKGVK